MSTTNHSIVKNIVSWGENVCVSKDQKYSQENSIKITTKLKGIGFTWVTMRK